MTCIELLKDIEVTKQYVHNTSSVKNILADITYIYYSENNEILGVVTRSGTGSNKKIRQRKYLGDGKLSLKWDREDKTSHIYRLPELLKHKNKPVLIVEGEKTADAAQELYSKFVVVTWLGGSSNVKNVDLTHFKGRTVHLMPDADETGIKAMKTLGKRLADVANEVRLVAVEKLDLPKGWDIADFDDEHCTIDSAMLEKFILDAQILAKPVDRIKIQSFPHVVKGKLLNTIDNLKHLLKQHNYKIRYNELTRRIEYILPVAIGSPENQADNFEALVMDLCVKNALNIPDRKLINYFRLIASENTYNPVTLFIESKKWDSVPRLDNFIHTIDSANPSLTEFLIRKWMISVIKQIYNQGEFSAAGVLVLQGAQGLGKTLWVSKLFPSSFVRTDMTVNVQSKDSILNCTSSVVTEIGELGSTFRKSDIEALKAFLTSNVDVIRPHYGRENKIYPRRTSFIATVNQNNFLRDDTGNRRWWVIECNSIDYKHEFDMQQVWAEVKHYADCGETPYLDHEELNILNEHNKNFDEIDPLEEDFLSAYDFDIPATRALTCSEILEELGYSKTAYNFSSLARKLSPMITKATGQKSKKSGSRRIFLVPLLKR